MMWQELIETGNYDDAEPLMLAETDRGEGYYPDCEMRASFYENWAEMLDGESQLRKYRDALNYWQMHAAQSTSGGEGTARMLDVNRVAKIIDGLS
ncbi:MAG TPA: hypothetical protein PKA82_13250 [Pyrinomonadaceae bacterium]|nr:hypothetical protein [Pyrinomonadaceae bacterium]